MKVTKELLDKGKSSNGFWSNKQIKLILGGKGWDRNPGWYQQCLDSEIDEDTYQKFLTLKNAHLKKKRKKKRFTTGEWIAENSYIANGNSVVDTEDLKDFLGI